MKTNHITFLFHLVREIPYGDFGLRSAEAVLENKKGSCSGKHLLLGRLYELGGLEVAYMMGKTNFRSLNPFLPEHLKLSHDVFDFHNFLKVRIKRSWYSVDATFDSAFMKFGFAVNIDWRADENCKIAFKTIDPVKVSNLVQAKKAAIDSLSMSQREERERFFKSFVGWARSIQ